LFAAALFPLGAYAYDGSFTRYLADDYCYAADVHARGFLAAQAFWYRTWAGRFTFHLAESALTLLGPAIAPLLPMLALVVWVLALNWAIKRWWPRPAFPKSDLAPFALAAIASA
jgi:hypothetical protein